MFVVSATAGMADLHFSTSASLSTTYTLGSMNSSAISDLLSSEYISLWSTVGTTTPCSIPFTYFSTAPACTSLSLSSALAGRDDTESVISFDLWIWYPST